MQTGDSDGEHHVSAKQLGEGEISPWTAQRLDARLTDRAEQAMPADEFALSTLASMHSAVGVPFDPVAVRPIADARRAGHTLGDLMAARVAPKG